MAMFGVLATRPFNIKYFIEMFSYAMMKMSWWSIILEIHALLQGNSLKVKVSVLVLYVVNPLRADYWELRSSQNIAYNTTADIYLKVMLEVQFCVVKIFLMFLLLCVKFASSNVLLMHYLSITIGSNWYTDHNHILEGIRHVEDSADKIFLT